MHGTADVDGVAGLKRVEVVALFTVGVFLYEEFDVVGIVWGWG